MEFEINPFEDDIVEDPRSIKTCVTGLNEKPLQGLLERFKTLLKTPSPRKLRHTHAWLVTSGEPGYGKSHLIGRLFKALSQKATLVYIRPYENSSTCWKSILLKIVQELDFPDKMDYTSHDGEIPTQLEVFSHGILVYLLSQPGVHNFVQVDKETCVEKFHSYSYIHDFLNDSEKIDWISSNLDNLAAQFFNQLKNNEIRLNASPLSWIRVLLNYLCNRSDIEIRETCLEWLKGESIDKETAKIIGIRSRDVLLPEITSDEINELCKQRVIDFCSLAGFFRPFLLCFDQTENYGKTTELVRSFGIVIENLVSSCPNQMTVVTANQHVWEKIILESMEEAHKHRFQKYFELEGINKEYGKELIKQRLNLFNIDNNRVQSFIDENWLNDVFKNNVQTGIRRFINACRDQWDKEKHKKVIPPSIEDYFEKNRKEVLLQPKRHVFDTDILYWMIFEVAKGFRGIITEKYKTEKGYFSIQWLYNTRSLLFGFELGSNSMRWQSIVREAERYAKSQKGLKVIMLRTFELPQIPKPTWKTIGAEIEAAKKDFFNIIHLQKDMVINIYAANELYRDAIEGDIPYSHDEVLAFIQKRFTSLWDTILGNVSIEKEEQKKDTNTAAYPTENIADIADEVMANIRREKLLSLDELLIRVSKSSDKEIILDICNKTPQIKVYQSSGTTLLQWQSNQ
jgi:hypothetical protein